MANWSRQYRLVAKRVNETGFEIGETGSDGRAIHIKFNVEKTNESTSYNSASITLWNLNEDQRAIIMPTQYDSDSENCTITLSAGYGANLYTIFRGQVSTATEDLDGADRKIDIDAVDLVPTLKTTVVQLSYSKSISTYDVIMDMADKWLGLESEGDNVTLKFSESAAEKLQKAYFTNGFSFIGYAQTVLDKICNSVSNMSWAIANGVLYIRYGDESIATSLYTLNASTGLIGIVKRKYSTNTASESSSASSALLGYEIEYLMNGAFGCGEYIRVESALITGLFLVSTISISGDNMSGDWTCTATIVEAESVTNVKYSNEES